LALVMGNDRSGLRHRPVHRHDTVIKLSSMQSEA
jgi:hypothetical protein